MSGGQDVAAFPHESYDAEADMDTVKPGMSLRDWFAGQALNGLLASGKWDNCGVGFEAYIATHAHNVADAMLAARAVHEGG